MLACLSEKKVDIVFFMSKDLSVNHIDILCNHLRDLSTEIGINASGRDEVYGCLFGRDSALTILQILQAVKNDSVFSEHSISELLSISERTLLTLIDLQGQTVNLESGEEPGKFIHEYRTEKYERLLTLPRPWYVYPDGVLRNYDSVDSTPLILLAIYRYYEATKDDQFLLKVLPAVEKGLNWIVTYGDRDKDDLLEYELPVERKSGGLQVQSWTDSVESVLQPDGKMPKYPIAPVEVQGYAWLALHTWGKWYLDQTSPAHQQFGHQLFADAQHIKEKFNESFLMQDEFGMFPVQALDGDKNQIKIITGNSLLLLWATDPETRESILDKEHVDSLVKRSFMPDLFDPDAGIRTMSTLSPTYNPGQDSYHNGSFWPVLNGLIYEGLRLQGYDEKARMLKEASVKPYNFFKLPIELYVNNSDGTYSEFCGVDGQRSCKVQAWSAAAFLHFLSS